MRRGFTLIEVMIAIAILAIVAVVPLTGRQSLQALSREADYGFALRNATRQVDDLRAAPFDSVPPQVVTVPADGRVRLARTDLVPGSVLVDGSPPQAVDGATGEIQVDPSFQGRKVVVDYRCFLPDRGEAHTVPADGRVTLVNAPVHRVLAVRLASGERLAPVPFEPTPDGLRVGAEAKGRVVVVDYLGGRVRNELSGRFLTVDLLPATGAGPVKELRVEESYGGATRRMGLTLLKVQP